MTNQERIRAFHLRLEGKSWAEIGAALGFSADGVRQDMLRCVVGTPRRVNCMYPALRRAIEERWGGSVRAFAADCGLHESALYTVLPGKARPSPAVAAAITRTTGLPYEEAFRTEDTP